MKTITRFALCILILGAILPSCSKKAHLSMLVVQSEMLRNPDASYLDGMEGKYKWNYTTGLELQAFLDVYDTYGGDTIFNYVEKWYDSVINEDGAIVNPENGKSLNYKVTNYSTDHICPGRTLFYLYDKTGKEKYRKTMDMLRDQIADQPRTPEGGFWHKKVYPNQMWLDGLYMAQPFYAEYTSRYEPDSTKGKCYVDIVNNFLVVAKHTYDPETKLYRHAWDSSHEMFWANDSTGQSQHAWGRALGWYCMAIVDVLPFIPEDTFGREELINVLQGIYEVLPDYADPETGMWYQVLDKPGREGNYTEATASAMFTYAMLKGVRLGYLPEDMKKYAVETYNNFIKEFVRTNSDGTIDLIRCCEVAGLGGKDNRSGDYDYYINERVRDNDPKGIGPLIWAALEMND